MRIAPPLPSLPLSPVISQGRAVSSPGSARQASADHGAGDVLALSPGALRFGGGNIDAVDAYGRTALTRAAIQGDHKAIKPLLCQGADIEHRDNDGATPLCVAALNGRVEAARELLKYGANIEHKGPYGYTPLMAAAFYDHPELVTLLLNKGARLEAQADDGNTALTQASYNGKARTAQLLLNRGANIEHKSQAGQTPLMVAASNDQPEMVTFLLNKGAQLEVQDNAGYTALSGAVNHGKSRTARLLLDRGANIEHKELRGRTPLMIAAYKDYPEIVRSLLDKGANIEAKDNDGDTALSGASFFKKLNTVRLLLERGANPYHKDKKGWTPKEWAKDQGHKDIATMLERAEAAWDARHGNRPAAASHHASGSHQRPSSSSPRPQHGASEIEAEDAPLLNAGFATSSGRRQGRQHTFETYDEYRQTRRDAKWKLAQGGLLAGGAVTVGVLAAFFPPIIAAGTALATGGGGLIFSAVKKFFDLGSDLAENPSFLNRFKRGVNNRAGAVKHWASAKVDPLRQNPKYKPHGAFLGALSETLDRLSELGGERSFQNAIAAERQTLALIERNILSRGQAVGKQQLFNTHDFLRKYNKYLSKLPENLRVLQEVDILRMGHIVQKARNSGVRELVEWSRRPDTLAKILAGQDFIPIHSRLLQS